LQDREAVVDFILNESLQPPLQDLEDAATTTDSPIIDEIRLELSWFHSTPAAASCTAVLHAMLRHSDRRWLRHPTAATLSALRWRRLRRYFYAAFSGHLLFCVIISLLVIFDQSHHATLQALSAEATSPPAFLDTGGTAVNKSVITPSVVHHNTGEWVLLALSLLMAIPLGLHTVASLSAWAVKFNRARGSSQEHSELPGNK
jgi:hypothetical protein